MKTKFISEFRAGEELVDELLLVKDAIRRTTKDGRPYLLCTLSDKTGQIAGVFWDFPAAVDRWLEAGLVAFCSGRVNRYKEGLQLNLQDLYPCPQPDWSEFLPGSSRPPELLAQDLTDCINTLAEPYKGLLHAILLDEQFLPLYLRAPAAKTMHHAYVGGLVEHSLSMAKIADFTAQHYPHINRDLLICGALLHDLGKVWEYSFAGTFDLSEDGRLIGHISRAIIVIEKNALRLGTMPEPILQQLLHLVLSHHGTQEWGSPVVPKTIEAVLLHQIDLMDSRMQGFFEHLLADVSHTEWTTKASPMHHTQLRRPESWEA